jgi:hypothetical protein
MDGGWCGGGTGEERRACNLKLFKIFQRFFRVAGGLGEAFPGVVFLCQPAEDVSVVKPAGAHIAAACFLPVDGGGNGGAIAGAQGVGCGGGLAV